MPDRKPGIYICIADIRSCVCVCVYVSTNIIIKRIIITPLSCTLALVNRADADGDVDCDGSCDTPPSVALNAHISRTCSHASTQSATLPLSLSLSLPLTSSCTALHCFAAFALVRLLKLSQSLSFWLCPALPSLCTAFKVSLSLSLFDFVLLTYRFFAALTLHCFAASSLKFYRSLSLILFLLLSLPFVVWAPLFLIRNLRCQPPPSPRVNVHT